MYIRQFITAFALLGLFITLPAAAVTSADCATLTRNLRLGMSGADVKVLQQFLNTQRTTMVADSGPGALGFETTYFGTKTQLAVIKFQNLYRKEVLTPAGLTSGSGFVGPLSRAKLLALCKVQGGVSAATPVPAVVNSGTTPASLSVPAPQASSPSTATLSGFSAIVSSPNDPLELYYPSTYSVIPGGTVSLFGSGFVSTGNTVHIGSLVIAAVKPDQIGALTFTIPQTAGTGKFDLWISNTKGSSNKDFIIINDGKSPVPVVSDITPKSGAPHTMVTVTGTGFDAFSNDVYASGEIIKGVPSPDGRTLRFAMPFSIASAGASDVGGVSTSYVGASTPMIIPIWFYVVNKGGISNNGIFSLKL